MLDLKVSHEDLASSNMFKLTRPCMEAGAQIAASAKQVITQQGSLLRWLQDDLSHRFTRQPLREPAEIHLWTINAERPRCEIDTLFGLLDAAEVAR
jgi:hypothetical protein